MPLEGFQLGHYRLVRMIGKGGMMSDNRLSFGEVGVLDD